MISYSMFFAILSLIFILAMILYYHIRINVLKLIVEAIEKQILFLEEKISNIDKKDPYADYRNAKGLLSVRAMREAKKNGKSGMQ